MLKTLQKRLALSEKGAKDFCRGVFFTTIRDIALMLPAVYVFNFLSEYLNSILNREDEIKNGAVYYAVLGIVFMIIMWITAKLQYRSTYTTIYSESAERRISLAEKLRKLPLAFFGEKNLSDLTSTIMSDNTDLEHTFSHAVPQLFASVISIVLIASGLFFYNWQMSLALFWVVPFAASILVFSKKLLNRENSIHYWKKRDVSEHIQEGLDTIQEIKSCRLEKNYLSVLDSKLETYEKILTKGELLAGMLVNSSQSLLKLGMASVIITGSYLLSRGSLEMFVYLVFLMIASRIYEPLNEVFNNLAALFFLDVRINRMNEMNSLPVQQGETEFNPEYFDIEFKNVSFSYDSGIPVLNNISFTAKQGEVTALVGPSGGGKTTAAKLSARFWDTGSGEILLGGRNIRDIDPETLLKHYSVVFQDVVLFNTTVMENIRTGRRDASDDEVIQAAKLAGCDDFINKMDKGYQTVIGENGERLSGGERQRISIARALLKDSPIVLLDEATASVDVENESRIQAGISELIKHKTVLIIAHRMRTVANADKIIVLENGKIAESGNPDELKKENGLFAKMVERQMAVCR